MGKKSTFNVHESEVQPAKVKREDGWREMNIKWLICEETVGCKSAVLFKTVMKQGTAHEKHLHQKADEICYVIQGKGRHGQAEEEWEIGAGDSYFVPRGVVHWAYGTDPRDPLILVGVYVGGGSLEATGYEFVERLDSKSTK